MASGVVQFFSPVRLAVAALLLSVLSWAGDPCNGAEEFCQLPLNRYTFWGTHNSGAFDLSTPPEYSDTPVVTSCFYENHADSFVGQLNRGVRYLSVDLCDKDGLPGVFYNCHAQSGLDDDKTAFGEKWEDSINSIKGWLDQNSREVVVLQASDISVVPTDFGMDDMQAFDNSIKEVFGNCTSTVDALTKSTSGVGCILWAQDGPIPTLADFINSNRRLLYKLSGYDYTWTSAYSGMSKEQLINHLDDYADELGQGDPNSAADRSILIFDVFRSQGVYGDIGESPEVTGVFDYLGNAISQTSVKCNFLIAQDTNNYFFPADDFEPMNGNYMAPNKDCDDNGFGGSCRGYVSQIEVAHQRVMDKGHNINAFSIDYENHGEIKMTIDRINFANVRRFKGEKEPSLHWYQEAGGIALLSILGAIVLIGFCAWACYTVNVSKSAQEAAKQMRKKREIRRARKREKKAAQENQGFANGDGGYGAPAGCYSNPAGGCHMQTGGGVGPAHFGLPSPQGAAPDPSQAYSWPAMQQAGVNYAVGYPPPHSPGYATGYPQPCPPIQLNGVGKYTARE